jgi:hypothetical protein
MKPKVYRSKIAQIKKLSESFIKRASSHYHKLLKKGSNPKEGIETDLRTDWLRVHCADLADSLLICYLIKSENFSVANEIYQGLDTLPRELFPNNLVDLLESLANFQEETEESGYRKA